MGGLSENIDHLTQLGLRLGLGMSLATLLTLSLFGSWRMQILFFDNPNKVMLG